MNKRFMEGTLDIMAKLEGGQAPGGGFKGMDGMNKRFMEGMLDIIAMMLMSMIGRKSWPKLKGEKHQEEGSKEWKA